MVSIRSAIELLAEKGPFTFGAILRSYLASELRRRTLNARHNTSIHPSARIDPDTKFGTAGRVVVEEGCEIRKNAVLSPDGGLIRLGADSFVNVSATLLGHGDLIVGENVLIGPHTTVVAANHVYADRDATIASQEITREGIEIADDVWIGSNCAVLDGVAVGEGSVVAAGSVVTESIPEYTVVAGAPAKRIGDR
jgi:acetyltransferase-like isoleucine patch superfamily enzyme